MTNRTTNRVKRLAALTLAAGMVIGGLAGCDDSADAPPSAAQAAERRRKEIEDLAGKAGPAPTTQELMAGARKRLRLGDFPVSLEVPESWHLKSLGDGMASLISVGGRATSGEIDIQLVTNSSTVPADRLAALAAGAKREIDAKPHPVNRAVMRDLGPIKVLEQRMLSNEFVGGAPAPEVEAVVPIVDETLAAKLPPGTKIPTTRAVVNPHLVTWRITLLIPDAGGKQYKSRALTFQPLKLSEFNQDREFLEKVVASLQYEP
ncbi:MAG: hypothetical protein ACAI43_02615 [Phycisphaerae bacterium]|nr:hypothetical protein [Tepidisphaeraceae bacterium]